MRNLYLFRKDKEGTFRPESEEFVVKHIGSETAARQKKLREEFAAFEKHAGIPQWLFLIALVLIAIGVALFSGALDAISDGEVPYETMVENGLWWFFGFGLGALAVGAAICFVRFLRRKAALQSSVCGDLKERAACLEKEAREELLVPVTAIPVDIISERSSSFMKIRLSNYINSEMDAFCDGPALCLASVDSVVKIPYTRIARIERVEKQIVFTNWNKAESATSDVFKRYKIKFQNGQYCVRPYYRIVLRTDDPCAILFPPYEFERLSPLLGSSGANLVTVKK